MTRSSPSTSSSATALTNLEIMERPAPEVVMYDEHRVIRFSARTEKQLRILLENEIEWGLDYFTHHKQIGGFVDARISPANYQQLKKTGAQLEYEVLIENVQQLLSSGDKDEDGNVLVNAGEDWFVGYHLYRDHLEWMEAQIRNHSTVARSFSAGKSFEGRYQAGVKIGTGPNHVVLHGLQHSREWMTESAVERHVVNGPMRASNYSGPFAFSTPEATNIARYLKSLPDVATYMDIHAYGQLILTPYGFTGKLPPSYDSYLKPLADGTVKALAAVHGTQFKAGDIYHSIYPASGSSIDYAMEEVRVPVPFGFELRNTGLFGLTLPADQILPSGQETWAAFTYILDNLKDLK
ncbi:hypothetical protein KI688_005233 [Linnemannia hyalina]|uniref:Peptidase M14 domain-containing protein n=1 Tax=Linnemannia hyalina TaxID=64524 RepID=A0A9P8BN23_9FUNG|nr:hypothetical protein KI688_005233 [Linnemannia hyalina]